MGIDQLKQNFFLHVGQTSSIPLQLEIERCEGIYYIATDGTKYIDFTSGIAVSNLGHQHPEIVQAVQEQAAKHLHTMVYGEFIEKPQVDYAMQLIKHLPEQLNSVYYCTSGSEAVEASLKLAKRHTKRTELVSCVGSYHGSTHGALSIMGNEYFKSAYRPLLPDTRLIRFNQIEDVELISTNTAAVVIELVQAASGVAVATRQWLQAIRNRCSEVGALLVFDEIQTGFGRTGELFAFNHFAVEPDILLLAKAMGGGVPIGALVANQELLTDFTHQPVLGHINTFGGNALAVSAAQAVLRVFEQQPEIINSVPEKAKRLTSFFDSAECVEQVSNLGLLLAVHFKSEQQAKKFLQLCLEHGIVLIGFLFNAKAIRLAPPLTITDEELVKALKIFEKVLHELQSLQEE